MSQTTFETSSFRCNISPHSESFVPLFFIFTSPIKIIMIEKGSKVRHIDPEIDNARGLMIVFDIQNSFALCG